MPGGGSETEKHIEEAIIREVREETNMRIITRRIIGYQEIFEPEKVVVQTRSLCIVEPIGPFIADPDEGEITEIKLIDPADLKKYIDWGKVGEHILKRAMEMKDIFNKVRELDRYYCWCILEHRNCQVSAGSALENSTIIKRGDV